MQTEKEKKNKEVYTRNERVESVCLKEERLSFVVLEALWSLLCEVVQHKVGLEGQHHCARHQNLWPEMTLDDETMRRKR